MTSEQGDRIIALLEQILARLPPLVMLELGAGDDPEAPCPHPEDARIDLSSMGEIEWICGVCKYRYGPVRKEKVHAAVSQQSV